MILIWAKEFKENPLHLHCVSLVNDFSFIFITIGF